jgi:hypothetical protein
MGIAVCGTHYSGMYAVSYSYVEEPKSASAFLLNGPKAANVALLGSLSLCFYLVSFGVVRSLRNKAMFAAATDTLKSSTRATSSSSSKVYLHHGDDDSADRDEDDAQVV